MRLHAPQANPDWKTNPKAGNFWQHFALQTNGIITPGNVLSVVGLVLVVWGAWLLGLGGHWVAGIVLVGIGRFFDVLDGYVAELTHTKSHLGATVDVACDKLAMVAILVVAVYAHLVWPWFLVLLTLYTVYLTYFGMFWGRMYRIYPNAYAKLAAFVSWTAVFLSVFHSKESGVWFAVGADCAVGLWAVLAGLALWAYHQELQGTAQARHPATSWAEEVTQLICVGNPRSTHYHQAHRLLVELGNAMGIAPQELDIKDHEQALRKLLIAPDTTGRILITVAGGDGTVSAGINTLLGLQDHYKAGECILMPLWGGNANDFAYMLNGLKLFVRPHRILTHTNLAAVPLIKLELTEPKKQVRTIYASCYASFGATAYAARQLEARRFSTQKLLKWFPPLLVGREIVAVVRALLSTPQYTSEIDEREQAFYEHSLINGSRIAKINRVPVSLAQPYFLHATITRKDASVIVSLLRMAFGRPASEYSMRSQLSFKLVTAVDAQIDGEVMHLPASTQVVANSVQSKLRFVSSKLN